MTSVYIAPAMAAILLTACTATEPMQPYYSPAPPPNVWNPPSETYSNGGYYAPQPRSYGPVYPQPAPLPQRTFSLVPQAEAAPAPQQWHEAAPPPREIDPPYTVPIDPSCGWWRLCNFYR
jgi:hypothetical protein